MSVENSYVWKIRNTWGTTISISLEPWANIYELNPREEIEMEAYDFSPGPVGSHILSIECAGEWITVYAVDDASVRIRKQGIEIDNLTWG
jgi:hypothetical protein